MADRPLPPVEEVDDEFIKRALDCGPTAANEEWAVRARREMYARKVAKSWPADELAARRPVAPGPYPGDAAMLETLTAETARAMLEMARRYEEWAYGAPPAQAQYFPPGVNPVPPPTAQGKLDALAKLQRKSRDAIRNGETHSLTEASRKSIDDWTKRPR